MCKETPEPNRKEGSSFIGKHSNALRLVFCASGICFSYFFYGILYEKLATKSRLGATFILVIQTITNCLVATVWKKIETKTTATSSSKTGESTLTSMGLNQPLLAVTSACYVFAMIGSNESLRFVPYPVGVLAKSCKLIPTMVMGCLIERRQYPMQQWMAAICISAGITLFNYSRMSQNQEKLSEENEYWKGMILLSISLCMDGFLGACQGMYSRKGKTNEIKRTRIEIANNRSTIDFINISSRPLFTLCMSKGY